MAKSSKIKSGSPKTGTARKTVAKARVPVRKAVAKKSVATKKLVRKVALKSKVKPATKKAEVKPVAKPVRAKKPAGFPEQLRDAALKVLDERQAEEVFTVDLSGKSSMADYLVIASGRASRQLSAIAHYLREAFEKMGLKNIRVEGLADANWVLVDAGDVIVHLFRPEVRDYYNLESMWSGKAKSQD